MGDNLLVQIPHKDGEDREPLSVKSPASRANCVPMCTLCQWNCTKYL
jgi:hypothetical protein